MLLLDDALSELDSDARVSVLHEIEQAEQVFLASPEARRSPRRALAGAGGEVTAA